MNETDIDELARTIALELRARRVRETSRETPRPDAEEEPPESRVDLDFDA
ncbi:MAG TPA: hypothetical protein VHB21_07250 [Minicystis sp.]|nr:hypothetical protein [Minicystis sp.]